jgi:lipopolysaccharide export system protein LptC
VIGTLETPDGAKTQLAAVSVRLEQTTGMLELSDGVELTTSAGLVVQAQGFGVATDRTLVESRGSVSASGPIGQLTAGAVRLSRSETPEGVANYVLVFNNGVRLLYQPQQ